MYYGPQEYLDAKYGVIRLAVYSADLDDLAGDKQSRTPRRDNQSARLFFMAIDVLAKTK
jgi:hypothetical protein